LNCKTKHPPLPCKRLETPNRRTGGRTHPQLKDEKAGYKRQVHDFILMGDEILTLWIKWTKSLRSGTIIKQGAKKDRKRKLEVPGLKKLGGGKPERGWNSWGEVTKTKPIKNPTLQNEEEGQLTIHGYGGGGKNPFKSGRDGTVGGNWVLVR